MLHFDSDYMEGAHPKIIERLVATNMEQTPGYGCDDYCRQAADKIRKACKCPDAKVHFMVGGTPANATVIRGILRHYEGVLAAETGHISSHEAGAIEAGGHKVLTMPQNNGKITAQQIEEFLVRFEQDANHEHMVEPGMVYISHPTEYGTLYTRSELEAISRVCHAYGIPLYLDGARLGYGLMAKNTDVTLEDIARLCDVFYIGGTKVGALFGEAVVITRPAILPHFFTLIKQQGGLLAKGRLLGVQFDTLFTNHLYEEIAAHAIAMAEKLKIGLADKGYEFYFESPTNQQFIIVNKEQLKKIEEVTTYGFWEALDEERMVIRLATSWATREEDVETLLELI